MSIGSNGVSPTRNLYCFLSLLPHLHLHHITIINIHERETQKNHESNPATNKHKKSNPIVSPLSDAKGGGRRDWGAYFFNLSEWVWLGLMHKNNFGQKTQHQLDFKWNSFLTNLFKSWDFPTPKSPIIIEHIINTLMIQITWNWAILFFYVIFNDPFENWMWKCKTHLGSSPFDA